MNELTIDQILDRYTAAHNALDENIEQNSEIFRAHQVLVGVLIDKENDLRDAVVGSKSSISNGLYNAKYIPQSHTYAEISEIDRLVSSGRITSDERNIIVKTIDRPAHVSINKVKVVVD